MKLPSCIMEAACCESSCRTQWKSSHFARKGENERSGDSSSGRSACDDWIICWPERLIVEVSDEWWMVSPRWIGPVLCIGRPEFVCQNYSGPMRMVLQDTQLCVYSRRDGPSQFEVNPRAKSSIHNVRLSHAISIQFPARASAKNENEIKTKRRFVFL